HIVTPKAEDYLYWALCEQALGRYQFSAGQAAMGLVGYPQDKALKTIAARLPRQWTPGGPAAIYFADETAANGHRMLERGQVEESLPWLRASLQVLPRPDVYLWLSTALHKLGRDKEALEVAKAGL